MYSQGNIKSQYSLCNKITYRRLENSIINSMQHLYSAALH